MWLVAMPSADEGMVGTLRESEEKKNTTTMIIEEVVVPLGLGEAATTSSAITEW
jgi:hypothetical protein